MTKKKDEMDAENYAGKVIAEMSALTDKKIMDAAAEDHAGPKAEAARLRKLLPDAAVKHGRERLEAARVRIADEDARNGQTGAVILSFQAKRAKFDRITAHNPGLTLAARQGERMDEAELDGYLADLAELGIADPSLSRKR